VFGRPISLALLVGMGASIPLLYDAPTSVRGLLDLAAVLPVVRLLLPRTKGAFRLLVIASIVSVLTLEFIRLTQIQIWIKRDLFAIFTAAVVCWVFWLARRTRQGGEPLKRSARVVLFGVYLGLLFLAIAFFANVFGYFGLSDLVSHAVLVGAYRAVVLCTIFVSGASIISYAVQSSSSWRFAADPSAVVRLKRRLTWALGTILVILWGHTVLNLFAVRQDFYDAVKNALNYKIVIGSASFEVANLVAFVLTLFIGYVVASVIRAILGQEILPRLKLARGLPNAIATITHYVVLSLIFLLALAAGGVELSKFTLLTGALGVGLGFGLQNIVSNFVSGLILLFERPVRVGDLLEINGVSGEVTKIGFRASTLHAVDGSDLIIPNASLISEQVVNWTLSGTRRQVVLQVPVALGHDPAEVLDLLRATVSSHPQVLTSPKPTALFLGYGQSALNFEVRFWAPRPQTVPELRSDVALSIAAAFTKAGIKVPVLLRDLSVMNADEKGREAVAQGTKAGG